MLNPKLPKNRYLRVLELFAIIHEEIGEAQKAFNDYAWKCKGSYKDICKELGHIRGPLNELIIEMSRSESEVCKWGGRSYREIFREEKAK